DLQGNADLSLHWTGGWEALQSGRGATAALKARLQVPRLAIRERKQAPDTTLRISALDAQLSGTLDAMALSLRGNAARASRRLQLETSATGGRDARGDWQTTLRSLQLQAQDSQVPGPWNLTLAEPLAATFASANGELRVGAAEARLTGPEPGVAILAWQPIRWQQRDGIASLVSKGELHSLPMGWLTLLANTDLTAAGLSGNLLFDGQWDITLADQLVARATLARRSGDIRIQADGTTPADVGVTTSPSATVNAGIRELKLQLRADGDTVTADFRWDSERAGNAQASLRTRLTRGNDGWQWSPDSPLEATLRANMPQVGVWSLLAPPGWRVRGTVDANLNLTGTRRTPQWSGSLLASEMAVRSVVDGIEFGNGGLRATLQGQRLNIDAFTLQGAGGASGGELSATGFATWTPAAGPSASALDAIRLQIDARARALRVSARADRRLAVSGTLQAQLDKARLQVRGALRVDHALFILPDETAPSLGSDVVVLRKGQARPGAGASPAPATKVANTDPNRRVGSALDADLLMTLDLGQDFRVRGRGIDTRVAGELTLRSKLKPGELPTVNGELRTVGGQFRAYSQQLGIERGEMRFSGAYDNPSLNILAIRPQLTQRVGVQITGSALLPRVRLYAEPDLPEAEKLAWLVLGRSGANGGAEAAVLQQAAMALLGGQNSSGSIAQRLGLDEISLAGATNAAGATSATVTLGKRISQNFYVAYESSLAGTLGTFSIFYDLSERFTLRARTGEKSAVDLIFKYSYD
ncbi:MAG: translocation/assembly module TamB domain-containing protein, partial [Burkholderiaceae bacterium]